MERAVSGPSGLIAADLGLEPGSGGNAVELTAAYCSERDITIYCISFGNIECKRAILTSF
jgi:hypothetical protein